MPESIGDFLMQIGMPQVADKPNELPRQIKIEQYMKAGQAGLLSPADANWLIQNAGFQNEAFQQLPNGNFRLVPLKGNTNAQ